MHGNQGYIVIQFYTSESFQSRTEFSHKAHLKCLEGPAHDHYSKTYGTINKSCLLNIKYFSLFGGGLPFDCMHDILEGIAPSEVKQLLKHYTTSNLFTLQDFNE